MAIATGLPIYLSDVQTELGLPSTASLATCFSNAVSGSFDATYESINGYRNSLQNFRGYGAAPTVICQTRYVESANFFTLEQPAWTSLVNATGTSDNTYAEVDVPPSDFTSYSAQFHIAPFNIPTNATIVSIDTNERIKSRYGLLVTEDNIVGEDPVLASYNTSHPYYLPTTNTTYTASLSDRAIPITNLNAGFPISYEYQNTSNSLTETLYLDFISFTVCYTEQAPL